MPQIELDSGAEASLANAPQLANFYNEISQSTSKEDYVNDLRNANAGLTELGFADLVIVDAEDNEFSVFNRATKGLEMRSASTFSVTDSMALTDLPADAQQKVQRIVELSSTSQPAPDAAPEANPAPTPDGSAESNTTYEIKSGDTLWDIATRRLGASGKVADQSAIQQEINRIAKDNGIANPDLIFAGGTLKLNGPIAEAAHDHSPDKASDTDDNSYEGTSDGSRVALDDSGRWLNTEAAAAFKAAQAEALSQGFSIAINSAGRTYKDQEDLYNRLKGTQAVAPPGSSLHESGNALDVENYEQAMDVLQRNGFVWANYWNDPWHFNYVG